MDQDPAPDQPVVADVPIVSAGVADAVRARLASRRPYLQDAALAAQGVSDPRWDVRAAAVRALAAAAQVAPVRQALHDDHPLVRAAAVRALGALGAYEDVRPACQDADWQVREIAVLALRAAGRADERAILRTAQGDPSGRVREAATMALGSASGVSRGHDGWAGWWQRAQAGGRHVGAVCRAQARLVHPAVWWGVTAVLACTTGFLAVALRATPGFAQAAGGLLALAIVVCAAGSVALEADSHRDAARELALATPTPPALLLLARAALVVGYAVALGAVGSVVLALVSRLSLTMLLQLWAPPLLAVVALALALAAFLGSMSALIGTGLSLVAQTCRVRLTAGLAITFDTHLWTLSPQLALLSLALLVFAAWYASRHPRLSDSVA